LLKTGNKCILDSGVSLDSVIETSLAGVNEPPLCELHFCREKLVELKARLSG